MFKSSTAHHKSGSDKVLTQDVAAGVVVRADHNYTEVPADFRVDMLKASAKVGKTPSDIFNNILLGKSVFLDHGFELVPGFRTITIYIRYSICMNLDNI